ncbi:MAG: MbcA/ParS/Xre antitoxin family protein [Saprospiraceae bacterium]|nr:MbcA/ParS/Xre antitoxin family protein [Saprospiraceae bacterium]
MEMTKADLQALELVPSGYNPSVVLQLVHQGSIDAKYLKFLKRLSQFTDDTLSDFLHLNVKTFRQYRDSKAVLRKDLQEHVVMLLSLMKHGVEVFGDAETFERWLRSINPFFDRQRPMEFLDTINGICYVDDRLTAIEYGDNV